MSLFSAPVMHPHGEGYVCVSLTVKAVCVQQSKSSLSFPSRDTLGLSVCLQNGPPFRKAAWSAAHARH